MEEKYGIPFIRVSYFGLEDMSDALYDVARHFEDNPEIMDRIMEKSQAARQTPAYLDTWAAANAANEARRCRSVSNVATHVMDNWISSSTNRIGASRRYEGPMGKSDRAFVFGALGLALGLGFSTGAWVGMIEIALIYRDQGRLNRASVMNQRGLALFRKFDDKESSVGTALHSKYQSTPYSCNSDVAAWGVGCRCQSK